MLHSAVLLILQSFQNLTALKLICLLMYTYLLETACISAGWQEVCQMTIATDYRKKHISAILFSAGGKTYCM